MALLSSIRHAIRQIRLLQPFVMRELREQFAGSRLGMVWTFLQPALLALLYWWVFDRILRLRVPVMPGLIEPPFIAFLLSGLLPWLAFSDSVVRGAGAVIAHRGIVTNLAFPYQVFPLAAVVASHVSHFAALLVCILIYDGVTGQGSSAQILGMLLLGICQLPLAAGLALLFAAFAVYLRDLLHLLPLIMQVLFYTAPLVYPATLVPANLQPLLQWHPYASFAEAFHSVGLWGQWPDKLQWLGLLSFGLLTLGVGSNLFKRLRSGFADVL